MAVATALFVLERAWVISTASVPTFHGDEDGTWAIAQVLTGSGNGINMLEEPPYSVLAGVMVAPAELFAGPQAKYRAGLVIAALAVLLAALCMVQVIRGMGERSSEAEALAYSAILLTGTVAFAGSFTWVEPFAALYLTAWLALGLAWLRNRSWVVLVATSVLSGVALLAHGRFIGLTVVWIAAVGTAQFLDLRSSGWSIRPLWRLLGAVAVTASVAALGAVARSAVLAAAWEDPSSEVETRFMDQLTSLESWQAIATQFVGHSWYMVTATGGMLVFGLVWLVHRCVGSKPDATRILQSGFVLLSVIAVVAVSAVATGSSQVAAGYWKARADYFVYGRYVDQVMLVAGALGLVFLLQLSRRLRWFTAISVAALIGLGAQFVSRQRGDLIEAGRTWEPTIAGVVQFPFDRGGLDLASWSLFGAALCLTIVGISMLGRRVFVPAVLAILAVSSVAGTRQAIFFHREYGYSAYYKDVPEPTRARDVVVVPRESQRQPYYLALYGQQYVLTSEGWRFEFPEVAPAALAADPPEHAGVLVLPLGVPGPSGWERVGSGGAVQLWVSPLLAVD